VHVKLRVKKVWHYNISCNFGNCYPILIFLERFTDIDKINIVSSQVVFELSSFRIDARSKSSTLVVNNHVDSPLFNATPDVDHPPFIHTTYFCLVDKMLRDNPDLLIDWVQIWDIWMPQVRWSKVWCFLVQEVNGFTCTMR